MKLTIDFETRSRVNLKTHGMHVYAKDPSTEILCLALKEDNEEPELWVPYDFRRLLPEGHGLPLTGDSSIKKLVEKADIVEAHNYGFEDCIWEEIMVKRFGFPPIPSEKARCSAAKAASYALPRALGDACAARGLKQQKDNIR